MKDKVETVVLFIACYVGAWLIGHHDYGNGTFLILAIVMTYLRSIKDALYHIIDMNSN